MHPTFNRNGTTLAVFWPIVFVVLITDILAARPAAGQQALTCGEPVFGTVATAGQSNPYTFVAESGDTISLTLVQTSAVDPQFTAVVTLVGPGTNITRSPSAWFFTLPAAGEYTAFVHDVSNTNRGSYGLRLGWVLPLAKQCGDRAPIACDQQIQASIDAPYEMDLFHFTGPQGSNMLLTLQGLADVDPGFQAHGQLFGPGGVALGFVPIRTTTPFTLPASGTYVVAIYDLGNFLRRGSYSLRLHAQGSCPAPVVAPSLAIGLNGSVFAAGATMTVVGSLSAGNVPGLVDAYIVLQLPTGQFMSLQLGGQFVAGIVPIARQFAPFDFQGLLAQYTFSGVEPSGTYQWYAVLTTPGTLNFVSALQQVPFAVP